MKAVKRKPLWVRLITLTCCFTTFLSGVMPGLSLAQETPIALKRHRSHIIKPGTVTPSGVLRPLVVTEEVVSLKEVPIPVPKAAIIQGSDPCAIPGPENQLCFKPLSSAIIKDQVALVRLGKALFWDMQVGSDGIQACASCHFSAGADNRSKNQVSPGLKDANFNGPIGGDNSFGNSVAPFTANDPTSLNPSDPPDPALNVPGHPELKPNYQLVADDFPLNDWLLATPLVPRGPGVTFVEEFLNLGRDTNDVISSQGVRHTKFVAVNPGKNIDSGTPLPDIFNTANPGQLDSKTVLRRVEPRNAPTVINAVFNFDNFWDGRASFIFNGVNPFGFRDRVSTLKQNINGQLTDVFIRITNSSLASQAVGPPGSNFEMSWEGRSFPDIGKKMTSLRPLDGQYVHPQDSVLGPYSRATLKKNKLCGKKGLCFTTYADMVKAAFKDQWWNSDQVITVVSGTAIIQKPSQNDPRTQVLNPGRTVVSGPRGLKKASSLASNQFTQMQFNFSLFFGLAVQAYEATLVSDNTPFDRFMGAPSLGILPDPTALNDQQRVGFSIFTDTDPNLGAKCDTCHVLPITTGHTVLDYQPDCQGVPDLTEGEGIETMIMGDGESASYDHGMYNTSVRRTSEDIGRGGTSPFINPLTNEPFPLSLVELAALMQDGKLPPDVARFVPDVPVLPRRAVMGNFKVPNIRNSKFSGPYFHNGDSCTLRQTVEFYVRGGNFPNTNFHDLDIDIEGIPPLMLPLFDPTAKQYIEALTAFMSEGLTDCRVSLEKAPFDHPQLFVPNGSPDCKPGSDNLVEIPAVGQDGHSCKLPTFLNLDPNSEGTITNSMPKL